MWPGYSLAAGNRGTAFVRQVMGATDRPVRIQTGSRLLRAPQAHIPDLATTQVQRVCLTVEGSLFLFPFSLFPTFSFSSSPSYPTYPVPFEAGFHVAQASLELATLLPKCLDVEGC